MASLGNQILLRLKMAKNPNHIIITKDEKELVAAFDKEVNRLIVICFIVVIVAGFGSATIIHVSDYHKYNSVMALQQKASWVDQGAPLLYDFDPHPCSKDAGLDGREIASLPDRSGCWIRKSPP